MTNLDSTLKNRDMNLQQSYVFSGSHVQMWELGYKEVWALKNWCFQIVVLENTLWESLGVQESNQSILKEINTEYSLEGLMLKLQYFGHLIWRADSLEKNPDDGKDWMQKKKGAAEDEHHQLNEHESEQTPEVSGGQRILVCYSTWGCKELDVT